MNNYDDAFLQWHSEIEREERWSCLDYVRVVEKRDLGERQLHMLLPDVYPWWRPYFRHRWFEISAGRTWQREIRPDTERLFRHFVCRLGLPINTAETARNQQNELSRITGAWLDHGTDLVEFKIEQSRVLIAGFLFLKAFEPQQLSALEQKRIPAPAGCELRTRCCMKAISRLAWAPVKSLPRKVTETTRRLSERTNLRRRINNLQAWLCP